MFRTSTFFPTALFQVSFRHIVMLSLSLLLALASGCTTGPVEPEQQPQKAIVLPIFTLHKELRSDASMVQNELREALQEAGYDCVELTADEFEKLQRTAFDESGSIYNPTVGEYIPLDDAKYRKSLLQQLRTRTFDVLIIPELQLRQALVQGKTIVWDGVSREMEVRGDGKYLIPREARGLSLFVSAYGSTGVLVGKGAGGITVPFYLDTTIPDAQFQLRQTFYDADEVSEGVAKAIMGLRRR